MDVRYTEISCGIYQIDHLCTNPGETLAAIVKTWPTRKCPAIYIWSNVEKWKHQPDEPVTTTGHIFAKFVEDKELGVVHKSTPVVNPNTGNTIVMWTWCVDRTKVEPYYAEWKAEFDKQAAIRRAEFLRRLDAVAEAKHQAKQGYELAG